MSVCADANITGTFLHFWTQKVHYKLRQNRLQTFDDGGLLSGGFLSGGLLSVHQRFHRRSEPLRLSWDKTRHQRCSVQSSHRDSVTLRLGNDGLV